MLAAARENPPNSLEQRLPLLGGRPLPAFPASLSAMSSGARVLFALAALGAVAAQVPICETRLPWAEPVAANTGCTNGLTCTCANFFSLCATGNASGLGVCDVSWYVWAVAGAVAVVLIALAICLCCCFCACCARCRRRQNAGGRVVPRGRPPAAGGVSDWAARVSASKATTTYQSSY